jgi:hypothetical protein
VAAAGHRPAFGRGEEFNAKAQRRKEFLSEPLRLCALALKLRAKPSAMAAGAFPAVLPGRMILGGVVPATAVLADFRLSRRDEGAKGQRTAAGCKDLCGSVSWRLGIIVGSTLPSSWPSPPGRRNRVGALVGNPHAVIANPVKWTSFSERARFAGTRAMVLLLLGEKAGMREAQITNFPGRDE